MFYRYAGLNENCNTSTKHSLRQGCYLRIPLAGGMRIEVGGSLRLGKGKEGLVQVVEFSKKMQMSEGVQIKYRCGNFKWIWSIHRMWIYLKTMCVTIGLIVLNW